MQLRKSNGVFLVEQTFESNTSLKAPILLKLSKFFKKKYLQINLESAFQEC